LHAVAEVSHSVDQFAKWLCCDSALGPAQW
jgi:hypothetical protein